MLIFKCYLLYVLIVNLESHGFINGNYFNLNYYNNFTKYMSLLQVYNNNMDHIK